MVSTNWEEDIKIQAVGANYGDPKAFKTDIVISAGKVIHLKDYKALYEESPAKAATTLMRQLDKELKDQITYVHDKSLAVFVEQIQSINRNGMNHQYHDRSIPLADRYYNSKRTAQFVNENYQAEDEKWADLKTSLDQYFRDEKKSGVNDNWVYHFEKNNSKNLLSRNSSNF